MSGVLGVCFVAFPWSTHEMLQRSWLRGSQIQRWPCPLACTGEENTRVHENSGDTRLTVQKSHWLV